MCSRIPALAQGLSLACCRWEQGEEAWAREGTVTRQNKAMDSGRLRQERTLKYCFCRATEQCRTVEPTVPSAVLSARAVPAMSTPEQLCMGGDWTLNGSPLCVCLRVGAVTLCSTVQYCRV